MNMNLTAQQFNRLSLALLGLTVASCLCAGIIFVSPTVFFNVLEPTRLVPRPLPTITPSPRRYPTLPPAWTSTPVSSVTATRSTPTPSATASETPTPSETGKARTPKPGASATRTKTATPKK